jgi:hypothetical protein
MKMPGVTWEDLHEIVAEMEPFPGDMYTWYNTELDLHKQRHHDMHNHIARLGYLTAGFGEG